MDTLYIENRIKYYRELLFITQKELATENISLQQVKFLETNRKKITIEIASELSNKLNKIANEKEIALRVSPDEFLLKNEEVARKICENQLENLEKIDILEFKDICNEYDLNDLLQRYYKGIADEFELSAKYDEAIQYYEKAINIETTKKEATLILDILNKTARCVYILGNMYLALQQYTVAEHEFSEFIEKDKNPELYYTGSKIYYGLAACNYNLKNYDKSEEWIKKISSLTKVCNSAFISSKILMGNIYYAKGEYNQGLELYLELKKNEPENFQINLNLAILYELLGNNNLYDKYIKELKLDECTCKEVNFVIAYLLKIKEYSIECDVEKAMKLYNKALAFAVNYNEYLCIGKIYEKIYKDFHKGKINIKYVNQYINYIKNNNYLYKNNEYLNQKLSNMFLELLLNRDIDENTRKIISEIMKE